MRNLISVLALAVLPAAANAATYTISFGGEVIGFDSGTSATVMVGDSVSAFYTYDDAALGVPIAQGTRYQILDAGMTIDGTLFQPASATRYIEVFNDDGIDGFDFQFFPTSGEYTTILSVFDNDEASFSDEALSNVTGLGSGLGAYETRVGFFNAFQDVGICDECSIRFTVSSVSIQPISPVPLPAGVSLLLSGLALLGIGAARRRARKTAA